MLECFCPFSTSMAKEVTKHDQASYEARPIRCVQPLPRPFCKNRAFQTG
jgi:hypothetical protein